MLIHTAHLVCQLDAVDAFRARLERHAQTSLEKEEGCHRFDVYQDENEPTRFFLYEIYADRSAFDAHRASEHLSSFRADTAGWVTERAWWFWTPLSGEPSPDHIA